MRQEANDGNEKLSLDQAFVIIGGACGFFWAISESMEPAAILVATVLGGGFGCAAARIVSFIVRLILFLLAIYITLNRIAALFS